LKFTRSGFIASGLVSLGAVMIASFFIVFFVRHDIFEISIEIFVILAIGIMMGLICLLPIVSSESSGSRS